MGGGVGGEMIVRVRNGMEFGRKQAREKTTEKENQMDRNSNRHG